MKELELSKQGWKNKGKYVALIDDDVFDIVNQYSWSYQKGYAQNGKMNILLHRYIWILKFGEIPEGLEVEHIDENPLNNQISNLRLANNSENHCNITKRKDNKSGFKGISKKVNRDKRHPGWSQEKWNATITKDYRKKTEKTYTKTFPYNDEGLQAIEWYKKKSLELHKEFSIYDKDKK